MKLISVLSLYCFVAFIILLSSCTARKVIDSPEKQLQAEVRVSQGVPFLDVFAENNKRIVSVRLGLNTSEGVFNHKIKVEAQPDVELSQSSYRLVAGKSSDISLFQNSAVFSLVNADGYRLQVEVHINETGVAFRYRMPGKRDIRMFDDFTAFTFPKESWGYFQPISEVYHSSGALIPSYEACYEIGVPMTQISAEHAGWCYPALIKSQVGKDTYWTLLTETAVRGNYCGTHLAEGDSVGCLRIAYPESMHQNRKEKDYPVFNNATPWRVLVVSRQLSDIVQNTWMTDLVQEEYAPSQIYKAGRATWSWLTQGDKATNFETQKQFVDLADTLDFEYCLVDACWDKQIGKEKIAELASYAHDKGVGLWLWYNCSVDKNASSKTPKGTLCTKEERQYEMEWLKSIGIKGIKVNLFGHDQQAAMRFYEDLLEDANTFELAVNLHGATLPRGWERMYPNLLSAEAVLGMEYAMIDQKMEAERPRHITMLVFTRNAVAPVDFTPVVLHEKLGWDAGKQVTRSTTAAFELALPVILQSGIQHYGLIPSDLEAFPAYVFDYLSKTPAGWSETRLLEGYPGEYAVLARRSGTRWFVAAINARKEPLKLTLDLSFTGQKSFNRIVSNGQNEVLQDVVENNQPLQVEVGVNDGVIFY